jgi:hypothetical protein
MGYHPAMSQPKVVVGPVLPEYQQDPSPWVTPVWPSPAFLHDAACPACGGVLCNGTPLVATELGMLHAECATA